MALEKKGEIYKILPRAKLDAASRSFVNVKIKLKVPARRPF